MIERVNNALNEVFLRGRFESRPLYLVLDNVGRAQLAESLDTSTELVEESCCREVGVNLSKHGDPFSRFETSLWRWSLSGRKMLPPFTALLFALSHAAEQMVSDGEFTAGNYYDRLSALVNIPAAKLSQHGRSTEQFWKALNGWLADNDFAYGRPTARAVNSNKYVGIAMSQAIVREADRQRFHSMFEKYGFANTDNISDSEIEPYIATWIHSSRPTRQLKAAWKKTELRSRICEAAISELEDWQQERASYAAGSDKGVSRLSLALAFRHDLSGRSVALYFGREQAADPVQLLLDGHERVELSNTTFAGFASVEPRSSIPIARSLLHGIELTRDDSAAFRWSGRPAIPLGRSDQGYWTEVTRVSMGAKHLVLVRDDRRVREAIESALEEAAAPGYTLATSANLKGLPPGWLLYENVVVERALRELRGFESVLSPVGETASLRLEGGMKLGRDIWHLWNPPTAHLEGGKPGVSISAWEGTSAEGEEICSASSDGPSVSLDLENCVPASGNVYLEGKSGRGTVASASLLFRSANRPRPMDRQARSEIAYTGMLSTAVGANDELPVVRGLLAPEISPVSFLPGILHDFGQLEDAAVPDPIEETVQPGVRSSEVLESIKGLSPEEVLALPCAVRGLHRLRFAAIPPGTPRYAPVDVECPDCGITYLHRRRPTNTSARTNRKARVVPESTDRGREIARREIDYDLWLDGACFLGSGPASVFEVFAASADVDTWRAAPVLRDLAWLGHLDAETGATHRAKSWSISPPAFSITAGGRAICSGFRCRALVAEIGDAISRRGGHLSERDRPNHPSILAIEDLDEQGLIEVAGRLRDPHGRKITVVSNAAGKLLSYLDGRLGLRAIFRPVSLGIGLPVQRFDPRANRWRNVDRPSGAGAYRLSHAGTSYVFLAPSGKAYSGPHELVKLAAARATGAKLHAYDPSSMEFSSRVGCEPAGLLGRVLVACRGELPVIERGKSIFREVPPGVAAGVLHYLYNGELPE